MWLISKIVNRNHLAEIDKSFFGESIIGVPWSRNVPPILYRTRNGHRIEVGCQIFFSCLILSVKRLNYMGHMQGASFPSWGCYCSDCPHYRSIFRKLHGLPWFKVRLWDGIRFTKKNVPLSIPCSDLYRLRLFISSKYFVPNFKIILVMKHQDTIIMRHTDTLLWFIMIYQVVHSLDRLYLTVI